jgi:hypothetical protein
MLFTTIFLSARTEALGVGRSGLDDAGVRVEAIDAIERWAVRHP